MGVDFIGKFLGRTKVGRFIVGGFLAGFVMYMMTLALGLLTCKWLTQASQVPFLANLLSNYGSSAALLVIFVAIILAMFIGCVITCFLFPRQDPWLYQLILMSPLFAIVLLLFVIIPTQHPNNVLLYFGAIAYSPLILGLGIKLAMKRQRPMGDGKFIRGTDKLAGNDRKVEKQLYTIAKEENHDDPQGVLIYKNIRIPYKKENQGTAIIGSPGSGKTQVINQMIESIMARNEKMIVWDIKGTYIQAFAGEPGVSILCPWDKRSIWWRLGADVLRPLDCQQAADILIPKNPKEHDPHFPDSARNVLSAVLIQLDAMRSKWGWQDLWDAISKGKDGLYTFLQLSKEGRAASAAIGGDTKAAHDVYATLMTAMQPAIWLPKAWGNEGISLREWVKDPNSKILIIGGMVENEKLAALTARLALQILVNEVLAMPDNLERRVWLFLDELAALGYHKTLVDAFTTGRSKGLCVVTGLQDIGRIEHIYGYELAKSLFNVFSTFVFLRCVDPATSQWASETIGYQETADFMGETDSGSLNKSKSTNVRHKPVFMASEIANFPDLTGVLKMVNWPVAKVTWPLKAIPQKYPRVVDASWVNQKATLDDLPPPEKKKETPPPPKKPEPPKDEQGKDQNPWGLKL